MADILETFDWDAHPARTRQIYDYDKIFDGHIRRYTKGKDFKCLAKSFQQVLLKKGKERKIEVRVIVENDNSVVAGKIG